MGAEVGLGLERHQAERRHVLHVQNRSTDPGPAPSTELAVMPMFERTFPGPIAVSLPQQ
jgi:hypothetical protein